MTNAVTTIDGLKNEILSIRESFEAMKSEVDFTKELQFAIQALQKNSYLAGIAAKNPNSLRNAMINVSAIGLSLNPALKLAYLVPRGTEVCLDISYMGLAQLATDSGSILWVQAQAVFEKDKFTDNGLGEKPTHVSKPFAKRGKVVGYYCIAKTIDNEFLTTIMSLDEVLAIRDRTELWKKNPGSGPWHTDQDEMGKKTAVKRGYKLWPKNERLAKAIDVLNEHEGINFEKQTRDVTPPEETELEKLSGMVEKLDNGQKRLLTHLNVKYKPKAPFESLDELNQAQVEYSINFLKGHIEKENQKKNQPVAEGATV